MCLGDLILFLDYDDPEAGIFAELFGVEHARAYIEARTANRFDEARAMSDAAWAEIGVTDRHERWPILESMVRRQYESLFAAMPSPANITFGNVDFPDLWPEYAREGHRIIDGDVIDVDGQRWGFVGGGLISPMRTPYEIDPAEYAAKLDTLGPVDVLFTHIPPHHPLSNYDVVARRFEGDRTRSWSSSNVTNLGFISTVTSTSRWRLEPESAAPSPSTSGISTDENAHSPLTSRGSR